MPHIGHQVEVDGDLKGDLQDGQIKIDRKDQWTEIEVESDGRDMKARVPNTSIVAGPERRSQDGGPGAARRREQGADARRGLPLTSPYMTTAAARRPPP